MRIYLEIVAICMGFGIFPVYLNASQEVVSSTGVGISDTKLKACEIALDHARREAAQVAVVEVDAQFTSITTDSGAQHSEDRVLTTKAFARLVEKQESVSFEAESGLIKCVVLGSFKVGFVTNAPEQVVVESLPVDVKETKRGSQSTELIAQDFSTGEPFCSKKMILCFREIYSKQLGEFGIQVLPPGYWRSTYFKNLDNDHYNYFFNRVSNRSSQGDVVSVTTKEALMNLINKKDEHAFLYVNRYSWSGVRGGFMGRGGRESRVGYSYGKGFFPIMGIPQGPGVFDSLQVSETYLKELDEEMRLVNKMLSDGN